MKDTTETRLNVDIRQAMKNETGQWTPNCLRPDDHINLIEQGGGSREAQRALSHIAECAYCRREYSAMRQTLKEAAQARALIAEQPATDTRYRTPVTPRWYPALVSVCLAAVFALIGVVIWQSRTTSAQVAELKRELKNENENVAKAEARRKANEKELMEAQKIAGEAKKLKDRVESQEKKITKLEIDQKKALAKTSKPAYFPISLDQARTIIKSAPDSTAGGSEDGSEKKVKLVTLISPPPSDPGSVWTTFDDHPTFRWKPMPDAKNYFIEIKSITENGNSISTSRSQASSQIRRN